MTPRFRLFMADQHVGLTQNMHGLRLEAIDLDITDCCLSNHWPVMTTRDPTLGWPGFRAIKRALQSGPYRRDRFDWMARWLAATHGSFLERHIDGIYVSFLPQLLHLYRYLRTKLVLHASYRLGGSQPSADAGYLIELIEEWHASGRLVVTASNAYDAAYIKFMTGIDADVIGVDCGHLAGRRWAPQPDRPVLLGPLRFSEGGRRIAASMRAALPDVAIVPVREAYPHESLDLHDRLCEHPAMIIIPYSVHCIAITECFRMGIPLFAPSHRLLVEWHRDHYVIDERKSEPARGVVKHRSRAGAALMPNPDDDDDPEAYGTWLKLCDWYGWPVHTFDSFDDLRNQLQSCDLNAVSERQLSFSALERADNQRKWERTLLAMQ